MTKYIAILFLPVFLKKFSKHEGIVIVLTLLTGYFYFSEYLETHILNLIQVGSAWQFNDSLFSLILYLTSSSSLSKMLVVVFMLALSVYVTLAQRTVFEKSMIMMGGALMLTTTVQPWYLLWMVPFLCFSPNRAWLLLTGLIVLAYHVLIRYQAEGIWEESLWIKLAIYIPFYLLLINDGFRKFHFNKKRNHVS